MTAECIAITVLRTQLNISRIDIKLLLFLMDQSNLNEFKILNELSFDQIERAVERMERIGYVQNNELTRVGIIQVGRIRDLIEEIKIRQN